MSVSEAVIERERVVSNIKIKIIRRGRRQPPDSNLAKTFDRLLRKERKAAEKFAKRYLVGSWSCSVDGMVRGYDRDLFAKKGKQVVYVLDLADNIDRLLNLKDVLEGKKTEVWEVPHLHPGNHQEVLEDSPHLRMAYVTSLQKKLFFCFDLIPAT